MNIKKIRIRDPFILTDTEEKCYYMYGTTSLKPFSIKAKNKFHVYKSYDLNNFEKSKIVFDGNKYFKGSDFWAAEVHKFNNLYYLLGTIKVKGRPRGTYIFVCDKPDGKFVPLINNAITPNDWECLDGTLYIEDDQPYLVFCKEWLQIGIGEIYKVKLSCDLKMRMEEPVLLFKATENKHTAVCERGNIKESAITDGPFLIKNNNAVILLWSTFNLLNNYCVLQATSNSINDKFKHSNNYVFDKNGGHCMLFKDLNGDLKLALHQPNKPSLERAVLFNVEIDNDEIKIKNKYNN